VRIAQLANFYGPASGGLRTAVDALGRGYVEAGHERALLVPGPDDSWTEDERGITVTFKAPLLPGTSYRMVLQPWKVREALDRIRPTNVEVSDKTTMVAAARWARRRGAGSVLLSHERLDTHLGTRIRWQGGLVRGVNVVNRQLLRTFDEVVVTSGFAAQEFARVATRPVHRVPLGVDLTTFHPDRAGDAGQTELPRLIYIGRLSEEKSPALAVATAVELHRQEFAFRLDVYGDGPDKEELVALAGDAPVVFHPYMSDRTELAARLASADVALSVCPVETFGLAILEALASGTPVVTSDRGGGHELVTVESGAWGAPDPPDLAAAVRRVLDRPRAERRVGARRQAEKYPWSATVASMLEVHATTLDRLVRA
jgi:alpha-1,6-mannosyltransferase